ALGGVGAVGWAKARSTTSVSPLGTQQRRAHASTPATMRVTRVGTAHAVELADAMSSVGVRLCPPYFNSPPHFSSIARASSNDSPEVGGNLSRQGNGRQASTISLECDVMPASLAASGMRGSSAELQALRTMSTCSDGSQRVATAHITSLRLEGSTSSSTTTTSCAM